MIGRVGLEDEMGDETRQDSGVHGWTRGRNTGQVKLFPAVVSEKILSDFDLSEHSVATSPLKHLTYRSWCT